MDYVSLYLILLSLPFLESIVFIEYPYFTDKIVFNSRLERHYGCCLTLEKCRKLCSVHDKCKSFFINENPSLCQLHSEMFGMGSIDNLTIIEEIGSKYYRVVENCDSLKFLISDSSTDINTLITVSSAHSDCIAKDRYKINSTRGDISKGESGGWCIGGSEVNPYVQVTFSEEHVVATVATQGRALTGQHVIEYRVYYSQDCVTFHTDGQLYPGNTDQTTVVINILDTPVTGKCFRINPTQYRHHMSMRFDFIGCSF